MARAHFRDMGTGTANRTYPPFTTTRSTVLTTGAGTSWTPLPLTIDQFTAAVPVAPGVGTAVNYQANQNTVNLGSAVSLSGTNTSVRGTMAAAIAVVGPTRDTTQYTIRETLTGVPTAQTTRNGLSYSCDSPNEDVSLYTAGQNASIFTAANPIFIRPVSTGLFTTSAAAKIIWPITGTFKAFLLVNVTGAFDGNITFEMFIDGGSSISITPANTTLVATDSQTLAVVAGDSIYWKATRNAGALNPTVAIIWGFTSL